MREYLAMASIYNDLLTPAAVKRPHSDDPVCYTSVHRINCKSVDDLCDLFLDRHGAECDRLRGYIYLYAHIDGMWQRITD